MKKVNKQMQNDINERKSGVIRGLFSSMPLPDLLSALSGSMSAGCLVCTIQGVAHRIYLRESRLVYSTSPQDKLFLLEWLEGRPGVSHRLLETLAAHGPAMPVLIKDLTAQRLIAHHEFPDIIRHRTIRILTLASGAKDGDFKFNANELPIDPLAEIDLEIPFALMLVVQEQERAPAADTGKVPTDDLLEVQVPTIVDFRGSAEQAAKYLAELTVTHPSGSSQSLSLPEGATLIGREESSDIWLRDDLLVSRVHARLIRNPAGVILEDLGSANGIFVNKVQVRSVALHDGDQFAIGAHQFLLRLRKS